MQVVIKQGQTFTMTCRYDVDGTYVPLASATSQVRDGNDLLILTLTVTLSNQGTTPGELTLSALPTATAAATYGNWQYDVKMVTQAGETIPTETNSFVIEKAITHA